MEQKKPSASESVKEKSQYLRGTLKESLAQDTSHFSSDDVQLLKFHGSYQQDDRDTRPVRMKEKKEKDFSMMVRSKIPGGRLSAEQYLLHDDLAGKYGSGNFRITTRQGIQFHGVLKKNLQSVIRGINEKLGTTSGACGDIVRNVLACPAPLVDRKRIKLFEYAKAVSDQFLSKSGTYQEVWLDGEKVPVEAGSPEEVEPIYGKVYLPRKFKIAFAFPGDNCIDVLTNDLAIIPELDAKGDLAGFNLAVGGGLGMTHGIESTYPRLASPLCFVKPEDLLAVSKAVVLVQRDNGNRSDRKRARLKYLLDERGLDWFRAEVENRFGRKTEPARKFHLQEIHHHLGWQEIGDGKWFLGLAIENGRVIDTGKVKLKSGLRALVEKYRPEVFLTANQDMLLSGFDTAQKQEVENLLVSYGISLPDQLSAIRKDAIACPALPTCALAISESERVLPAVVTEMEAILKELGLWDQRIITRMTGCPNGCARPYNAEIAFVGRGIGSYNIYVGGNLAGERLAFLLLEKIPLADLAKTMRPILVSYRDQRRGGECFGDFARRLGADTLRGLAAAANTPA